MALSQKGPQFRHSYNHDLNKRNATSSSFWTPPTPPHPLPNSADIQSTPSPRIQSPWNPRAAQQQQCGFCEPQSPPSGGQLEYKIWIPGATYLGLSSNPSTRRRIALEGRHGPINYYYSKTAHWENRPGCPSADLWDSGTHSKSVGGLEIQLT